METKFESVLKNMSLEEKAEVMRHTGKVFQMFKTKCGGTWIDDICSDEALKNLYIMSCVSANQWLFHYKKENSEQ